MGGAVTTAFTESVVEEDAAVWLGALGYATLRGPDIAAGALYRSGR
jgi:hypothetical protein